MPEIDRLDKLISQVRELARPVPVHFTSVNIESPIEKVLNLLGGQIEKIGVQVTKDYTPEAPAIWADESQLQQLFLNLIMNSLQAMPQGGQLYIKTYVQPSLDDSRLVCLDISDTGEGIAEADLQKVFDPFFTTKGGTGLGLMICQQIIDLHKGTIKIDAETGKGVTVTVCFHVRS